MPTPTRCLLLASMLLGAGCVAQPRPAHSARPAPGIPARVVTTTPAMAVTMSQGAARAASAAEPASAQRVFLDQLVAQHPGLDRAHVAQLLAEARVQPSILAIMQRPAESKPWKDYRPIFLGQARIDAGIAFYRAHRALVERIADRYGVSPSILVAILGVETYYGRQTGGYRVLDALYTLAFDYPPRADFFRKELGVFLSLPPGALPSPRAELRGSYAGAMGWCQFMPSSLQHYGVSADGTGPVDLWNSLPDILASTANYLAAHGWQHGEPIAVRAVPAADAEMPPVERSKPLYTVEQLEAQGFAPSAPVDPAQPATLLALDGADGTEYWLTFANFQVITRYNTSAMYALAVTQLAGAIAQGVRDGSAMQ